MLQSGGGLYDFLANKILRPKVKLKHGEKHAILKTKEFGWTTGSYIGPGTRLTDNIRNNVQPKSDVDRVAQAHDLRYAFATNHDEVRAADMKMIAKVKDIKAAKSDHAWNIKQAELMRAKVWLEDKGLPRTAFATFGHEKDTTPEDIDRMKAKLTELEQAGYGKKKKTSSWLQHVAQHRKAHPNLSYKAALSEASKTYGR